MIQVDDIVGIYTSHCTALTTTLQYLTVQPEGVIVLQGENNTNNLVQPTFSFTDTSASAKFAASIATVDGPSADIDGMVTFGDADGTWTFSGGLAVNQAPAVPFVGSNTIDNLSQAHLDNFKALFPNNPAVQAVTLGEVLQFAAGKPLDGQGATLDPVRAFKPVDRSTIPPCLWASAAVAYDVIAFTTGMVGLARLRTEIAQAAIAEAIEPILSDVQRWEVVLSNAGSTLKQKATAVWQIAKLIWTGGMFEAIWTAITSSLSWWDMIFYGVLGLAEITAAFLTEGAAVIALILAEIALAGFIISDGIKAEKACFGSEPAVALTG